MEKKYLLQEEYKGEVFLFGDFKNLIKAIKIFEKESIPINIRFIRKLDTMTQKEFLAVSKEKLQRVGKEQF